MRWEKFRRSSNVVDAGSGGGPRRFGGLPHISITGIIIILIISWITGQNPLKFLGLLGGSGGVMSSQTASQPAATTPDASTDAEHDFVKAVLGSTEDVWGEIFRAGGARYTDPQLVLFNGFTPTACGAGQTAMGPFYCPGDQKVYLDLAFFNELETKFHASGDFARAYVIAHEVGHHVQNLLGIFDKVAQARQQGAEMEGASGLSVRQELQADCFAGVWANHAQQRMQFLEPGDIESALAAASGVGDDTLQKQSRGYAVPDSFTHGTSEQRVRWFKAGFQSGSISQCDTFKAQTL
ncbi:MAG TPA: neutral zinc metallopeptidase [Rhodanobacteraceae bacterium]|nr:neutral zinc metallopeptidase [Rhodanobacteraceae bacterium]